jgi:DNA-binding MarR family transcriptional regulator
MKLEKEKGVNPMLTISEYAVLKAIAEKEEVTGEDSIVQTLLSRGLVKSHYEITEQGKDELNTVEEHRWRG